MPPYGDTEHLAISGVIDVEIIAVVVEREIVCAHRLIRVGRDKRSILEPEGVAVALTGESVDCAKERIGDEKVAVAVFCEPVRECEA